MGSSGGVSVSSGNRWLRFSLGIIFAQAVFVVTLATISSRPIPFEFERPIGAAMAIWIAGLAWLTTRTGLSALKTETPLPSWRDNLLAEGPTVLRALQIALVVGLAIALHGWAKSMIPHVTGGYWADPMLTRLDAAIFGQDPWRLFRSDLLAPLYSTFYVCWFPITFGTMGIVAFSAKDHSRLILAYLLTLILGGTIGQYVLPSAGPIFYERLGFGLRFQELVATNDPVFNGFAAYLWRFYESGSADLGTGISAMPSMHISLAVWTVLAARTIWRPLAFPMAIYAALLWAASIASGWHYATDGLVGAAVALVCYALAGRLLATPPKTGGALVGETA